MSELQNPKSATVATQNTTATSSSAVPAIVRPPPTQSLSAIELGSSRAAVEPLTAATQPLTPNPKAPYVTDGPAATSVDEYNEQDLPKPANVKVEEEKLDPHTRQHQGSQARKVSAGDIQLVQNLIERCLQLYMSQREVVTTLHAQARIEPGFTGLVWQVRL